MPPDFNFDGPFLTIVRETKSLLADISGRGRENEGGAGGRGMGARGGAESR